MYDKSIISSLTVEEKLKILPFIAFVIKIFADIRESGGALSAKQELYSFDDKFFDIFYHLLMGSYETEVLTRILSNLLNISEQNDNKVEYAKKVILSETAVLTRNSSPTTYQLNLYLFSFFGTDFIDEYKNGMKLYLPEQRYKEIFLDDIIFSSIEPEHGWAKIWDLS